MEIRENWLKIGVGVGIVFILIIAGIYYSEPQDHSFTSTISANLRQLLHLTISPEPATLATYHAEGELPAPTVIWELNAADVDEKSISQNKFKYWSGYALVPKSQSGTIRNYNRITQTNTGGARPNGLGSLNIDTRMIPDVAPDGFRDLIRDFCAGSYSDCEVGTAYAGVTAPRSPKVIQTISMPNVIQNGGTADYTLYTFVCEGGFTYANSFLCKTRKKEITVYDERFCVKPGALDPPKGYSSWNNYCFRNFGPGYCDGDAKKCVQLCTGAPGYNEFCLAKFANDGDDLGRLMPILKQEEAPYGYVSKSKICGRNDDCDISQYCELQEVPAWLTNFDVKAKLSGEFTGGLGICRGGCRVTGDCRGDAGLIYILDELKPAHGWTCDAQLGQIGECRAMQCRSNNDCWGVTKTQMSECTANGECQRISCQSHYDCWNWEIIPVDKTQGGYLCSAGMCTWTSDSDRFASIVKQYGYLSPEHCTGVFGTPKRGFAYTVSTDGKCKQEEIEADQCTVGGSKAKIKGQCDSRVRPLPKGHEWQCRKSVTGYGTCYDYKIPLDKDCSGATNPDGFCMARAGDLPIGYKSTCDTNMGICVLTLDKCSADSDCTVGGYSGKCINGMCDYSGGPGPSPARCGNYICEAGENYLNCPTDCRREGGECGNFWEWILSKLSKGVLCTPKTLGKGLFRISQDVLYSIYIVVATVIGVLLLIFLKKGRRPFYAAREYIPRGARYVREHIPHIRRRY